MFRTSSRFPGRLILIPVVVLAMTVSVANAQTGGAVDPHDGEGSTLGMLGAGILGGTVGFLAGALWGIEAADCPDCPSSDCWCGIGEAFWGGLAGEAFLLPTGIHLANRSRGDYGRLVLTSAGIAAVGAGLAIGGAYLLDNGNTLVLLPLIPVVQLLVCIDQERDSGRENLAGDSAATLSTLSRRHRDGSVSSQFGLVPLRDGVMFTCGGSF
ncbi:MAG: hypothetical protein ABIF77_11295 [bacterium]